MNSDYIDAHHHFWIYEEELHSWITPQMGRIRRNFLPADFEPVLKANGFSGSILVQVDQSEDENLFQLRNAEENDFVKGLVGWIDLEARDISEKLDYYKDFKKMKGFRHILQGEVDRAMMLRPTFMNGIRHLTKFGFTYDILIYEDQLQYIPDFVSSFEHQLFVIDHIAKPNIKEGKIDNWRRNIEKVARFPNVYCKISGMVTECDWKKWTNKDFRPYLDVVVNAFGIDRLMYGSDWPVCLVAAEYDQVKNIVDEYFSGFSDNEREKIYGLNAIKFYHI